MEITVISEEENPMLHRTDVQFRVSHAEATPDRLAVRDSLAARLNKDANEVVIRKLDTKFGMRETVGEAKVYQGAEAAMDVEQVHMLARNKIGDAGEAAVEADEEPEVSEEGEAAEAVEPEEQAPSEEESEGPGDEEAEAEDDVAEADDGSEAAEDRSDEEADAGEEASADDAPGEEAADDEAEDEETEE